MNKKYLILLFSFFFIFVLFSEKIICEKNKKNSISEVEKLLKSANATLEKNIDNSLAKANEAYKMSMELDHSEGQIKSLRVLSDIFYYKENFKKALEYTEKLQKAEKKVSINNYKTLMTLAIINMDMNKHVIALKYYKELLIIKDQIKDIEDKTEILNNIGIVYGHFGDFKNELKYYLEYYKILVNIDDKEQLSLLLNNIGTAYSSLKDIDKSLEFYKKANSIAVEIKDQSTEVLTLGNIAEIYSQNKDYKQAIIYFKRSIKIGKMIKDKEMISYCLGGLGECYLGLKSYKLAEKNAREALAISKEIDSKVDIVENYQTLGIILLKQKRYKESLGCLKNAEKIAIELKALPIFMEVNESYSDYYKEIKNYNKAYEYLGKYLEINDKIYDKNSRNKAIEMQTMYETLEKDQEIRLLNKDKALQIMKLNKQKLIRNLFISAIFVFTLVFFLIYNRYRLKKKAHRQLEEAHKRVEAANQIITEKNLHITDSINYAQNIQLAILPLETKISSFIKEYFILFKPKDIVSGDFYWFNELNGTAYIAVVDCTGHGVPGAFMSMIGYSLLNQILLEKKILDPAGILDALSSGIKNILKQDQDGVKTNDGMDVCLCSFNSKKNEVIFSGARRPLYYLQSNEIKSSEPSITEIKGTRRSVGGSRKPERRKFINHKIDVNSGDIFYLTSDGFADQSSTENTKFSSPALRKLLSENSDLSLLDQKEKLASALSSHQKTEEQRDDITVFGFKVP